MNIYLVGGAVRDHFLGLEVKDRDYVVVGSSGQELLDAGFSCVGMGFPVYLHPETREEYALARRETKVGAGYTGFEFETADVTLEEDLSRRDLTINSMAMGPEGIAIDPFGGMTDLKNKLLRHTSGAFAEDPLRVIRLARFYARYKPMGFRVVMHTKTLACSMAEHGLLDDIPDERFWLELEKVFSEENPKFFFELLWQVGALKNVSFFQRMLGKVTEKDLARIMNLATASMILETPKQRLAAFASLVNPLGTSAPTSDLAIYCRMGFCPEPEKVLDLFQKIRAFSEGPRAENLVNAVLIWEIANLNSAMPMSSKKLRQALEAARTVTAAPFVHLEGPEIGIQMSFARVEKIKSVL